MSSNFSKNISDKRKGVFLILMSLVIMVSSFAFMTDNKQNKTKASLGTVAVSSELRSRVDLKNLAPGDGPVIDLTIQNQGSLDGLIRTTYSVVVPEEDINKYVKGDISLQVDNELVLDIVNTPHTYKEESLDSFLIKEYEVSLGLSKDILNGLQDLEFQVDVLTEIKQLNSSDWEELVVDKIKFGGDSEYEVVPSNNVLRSSKLGINRASALDLATQGYVTTTLSSDDSYTVAAYKDLFLNPNDSLVLQSSTGSRSVMDDDSLVIPGSIIQLVEDGVLLDELTVISKGDVDGDGLVSLADMSVVTLMLREIFSPNGALEGNFTLTEILAADMDDDSKITINDLHLMRNNILDIHSDFIFYPQAPNLRVDPRLGLSFNDNSDRDKTTDMNVGNVIGRGGYVEPGQSFKVSIDTRDLAGLGIRGLDSVLELGSEYLEFDKRVNKSGDELNYLLVRNTDDRDVGSIGAGKRGFTSRLNGTLDYTDVGVMPRELPFYISTSGSSASMNDNSYIVHIGLRVKDDAPSGARLDINLKGGGILHEGYSTLTFYNDVNFNVNNFVRVK